jgi:Cation transporter/ATPase, N-terminus
MKTHPSVLDVTASRGAGGSSATIDFGAFQGLNDLTVRERLSAKDPNELPASKARGALRIALEVARQPMFMLWVGAGALYLAVGKPTDAGDAWVWTLADRYGKNIRKFNGRGDRI